MKFSSCAMLAAGFLAGAASLSAQTPRNPFGTGELPEFLKPYDLNEDGVLSVEERQAFEKALREARENRPGRPNPWDTDGDGVVSEAEREAARAAIAERIEAQRVKRFNELDLDDDGLLSAEELAKIPHVTATQVAAMITRLDKDGDGKISLAEFTAPLVPVPPPFPPLPPLPPGPGPCPAPPILRSFDTDNNGILSPAERAAFMAAVDTDGNGFVTPEEWRAYLLAHPELLPPGPTGTTQPPPPTR